MPLFVRFRQMLDNGEATVVKAPCATHHRQAESTTLPAAKAQSHNDAEEDAAPDNNGDFRPWRQITLIITLHTLCLPKSSLKAASQHKPFGG
jgi:hypothetical protein